MKVSGHWENTKQLGKKQDRPENHFPLTERILQKVLSLQSSIFKHLLAKIITRSYKKQPCTELRTFFREILGRLHISLLQPGALVLTGRQAACF